MRSEVRLLDASCRLAGEVDLASATRIGGELLAAARRAPGATAEIECGRLTFIDASGISMLLRVASRSGKQLRLVNVTSGCRRVFEVLDLCEQFGIGDEAPERHLIRLPIPA